MTPPAREHTEHGALRELADDPSSRKRFLRMMGGAGAASAFAIFVAACGDDDDGGGGSAGGGQTETQRDMASSGDLEIVQYALTLEHLETDFYNAVIDAGPTRPRVEPQPGRPCPRSARRSSRSVRRASTRCTTRAPPPVWAPESSRRARLAQRREIAESGTVEASPRLSQYTSAVPAFGSTERTLPISPVVFLRTCPGGRGVAVF